MTERLPWVLRPVDGPAGCRLPAGDEHRAWLTGHLGEALTTDTRGVHAIPRERLVHLVRGLTERFQRVDVFLDHRDGEPCGPRCRDAAGDDCVCSCLGRNHGGGEFWRRCPDVAAPALVGDSGVRRRHLISTATGRIWLDVPFEDKDEAKRNGARWDATAKRWYAPGAAAGGLARWAAKPPVSELLPHEDRGLGSGLFVDLVPSSCWFTNVRSCVAPADWERLRRMIVTRAGGRCEVCHAGPDPSAKVWLEAHERWTFDAASRVQRLGRLICLCTPCHTVTHFGLAGLRGRDREAFSHLVAVTGMTEAQAREHVEDAFRQWRERSRITWSLDLSMLTDAGITLAPPPEPGQRAAIADDTLTGH
ncbi:DUF5710 domain-containing protein [Actinoplanes oblitus]|uniref:DUF5710 domain-containing protein n=1 Tax=Actinoplanes oblitus TaxID=3040509 RepID=A0ABY8WBP6_9ACTN|nr:DUF5710 domain-containing protein [Actinoplanes oblitus]WIM93135.1 DUF5710 domain-containing protein [Actinoplanes oblitus]